MFDVSGKRQSPGDADQQMTSPALLVRGGPCCHACAAAASSAAAAVQEDKKPVRILRMEWRRPLQGTAETNERVRQKRPWHDPYVMPAAGTSTPSCCPGGRDYKPCGASAAECCGNR